MKLPAVICIVFLASLGVVSAIRYDNYTVYKVLVENKEQLDIVNNLAQRNKEYSLWKEFSWSGRDVDIMVSPRTADDFRALTKIFKLKTKVMVPNVQSLIDEDERLARADASFGWTSYHSLDEINAWLDETVAQHSSIASISSIGKSYQGRDIRALKISSKPGNPGIFIESNIHAREWITSATVTYFINELLTSNRAEIINLRENIDWYIVPVFNVDGFVYSHQTDRMWRKTRQPVSTSKCIGTDANRNFDTHWMENSGASSNPCDETFAGTKPLSEPEAEALANYLTSLKDKLNIYLSFHSYGQYLLCPYGHSKDEFPDNYPQLLEIGKAAADAIKNQQYGTEYRYGSTASVLYVASGCSVDWVFNELGIKVGFTLEFRDLGRYGFVIPAAYIKPNAQETIEALIAIVAKSKELEYI